MAKDSSKAAGRTGPARRGKGLRRAVVRVRSQTLRERLIDISEIPCLWWGMMNVLAFGIVIGGLVVWTREQPMVAVGQIMPDTRTVRVAFTAVDTQETDNRREEARQRTARIYQAVEPMLEEIAAALNNLPRTLAGVESLEKVDTSIRTQFGLSADEFAEVRAHAADDATYDAWRARVATLDEVLRLRPFLDAQSWQRATQEGLNSRIELRFGSSGTTELVRRDQAINIGDAASFAAEVETIVRVAGFTGLAADVAVYRLTDHPRPTFNEDATTTAEAQASNADAVDTVLLNIPVGQSIFTRGDVLSQPQFELYRSELSQYRSGAGFARVWTHRLAIIAAVLGLAAMIGGYVALFCPKIARRPARISWLAILVAGSVVIACVGSAGDPRFMVLAAATPITLVATLLCVAYDRRTAIALAGGASIMVALALGQPVEMLLVLLVGVAGAASQLAEIRDRRTLIRMAMVCGLGLAAAAVVAGLIDRPFTQSGAGAAWRQTAGEAAQAGIAGLLAGGIALFILPFVERTFDITTGMTLIELRDPKQPLLREMQQRAPGTYNHSLNVASIAEAAAESINADSLLTYVGCLYHDIGKINKPEYFVENQAGGPSKHDKLSPAMSLLVIVGHVKDGIEMARDYGLPKNLLHFIEAHHGTTLVEYFYNRARKQATESSSEGDPNAPVEMPEPAEDERLPEEVDYRYPGPRPQTKEVAITMLADAVESATRTLAEPTPARIESLVRMLANRRLTDGQYDECDLTLRELDTICDSISKSVASIYHGRIRYQSTAEKTA